MSVARRHEQVQVGLAAEVAVDQGRGAARAGRGVSESAALQDAEGHRRQYRHQGQHTAAGHQDQAAAPDNERTQTLPHGELPCAVAADSGTPNKFTEVYLPMYIHERKVAQVCTRM
jgi:hypothetical protein